MLKMMTPIGVNSHEYNVVWSADSNAVPTHRLKTVTAAPITAPKGAPMGEMSKKITVLLSMQIFPPGPRVS